MNGFLPVTKEEMIALGWDSPDFVYVSGDAYVDHPSFGAAIITRVLASQGFRVCMLSQPNWKTHAILCVSAGRSMAFCSLPAILILWLLITP